MWNSYEKVKGQEYPTQFENKQESRSWPTRHSFLITIAFLKVRVIELCDIDVEADK